MNGRLAAAYGIPHQQNPWWRTDPPILELAEQWTDGYADELEKQFRSG